MKSIVKFLRNSLFIKCSPTPNPNYLKFIPTGKTVMPSGTHNFDSLSDAQVSPLARCLFTIHGISNVFYGHNYISIGKDQQQS